MYDILKYLRETGPSQTRYQLLCANCNWIKRYENKEAPYAEHIGDPLYPATHGRKGPKKGTPSPTPGEKHAGAKLTEKQVLELKRLRAQGKSYVALAVEYKVSRSTVRHAVTGYSWRHLLAE